MDLSTEEVPFTETEFIKLCYAC